MMIDVQQKEDPGHQKLGMHCMCFITSSFLVWSKELKKAH